MPSELRSGKCRQSPRVRDGQATLTALAAPWELFVRNLRMSLAYQTAECDSITPKPSANRNPPGSSEEKVPNGCR